MKKNRLHAVAGLETDPNTGRTYHVSYPAHAPESDPKQSCPVVEGEPCQHRHRTQQGAFECSRNRWDEK